MKHLEHMTLDELNLEIYAFECSHDLIYGTPAEKEYKALCDRRDYLRKVGENDRIDN